MRLSSPLLSITSFCIVAYEILRLVQAFKTKIISLHAAFKRSKGGNPVKRLLNTWQNSSYSVTTYYNELETDKLDLLRLLSFADFLEHLDEGLEV